MTALLPSFRAAAPETWTQANWPLGAHLVRAEGSATFAVYAKHAIRMVLELYEYATGQDAVFDVEMRRGADDVWRAKVSGVSHGALYGFRSWGKNWTFDPSWKRGNSDAGFVADYDDGGNRYNPNKLLFDPYARELSHERYSKALREAGHDGAIYGGGSLLYQGTPRRNLDTGRWAPKGVVVSDATSTGNRPHAPAEDAAIYEAHVRNLTAHPSASTLRATLAQIPGYEHVADVPAELRGTFAGAALLAPYVKALGFTAIELLPVQESDNGVEAIAAGGFNHWGYMTLAYFAPDRDYAADQSPGGPTREFKNMVRAFHEHGIEVYLDVVFNHTAEGGNWNARLDTVGFVSLGGFDTSEYYALSDQHYLVEGATGCGNQLNAATIASQRLVLDSLRYWTEEMGVDGFRFDLAPVLGRSPNTFQRENWDGQRRFFQQHPLLNQIRDFGEEKHVEMIAEAWDLWGYEVGNFPCGWGEWNGRFRDAVRKYLKGDGNAYALMSMVNGDYEHFSDQGGPQKSVNFVTAHDGFTLMDLVSYNEKNNDEPPPFGPSDGGNDDNLSWDSGGDQSLRRQRMRNFWTLLFFSRGVPLAVSGDELGRTQNGNNNPYAINSAGMWNNYAMAASSSPTRLPVDPANPEARYHDNFGMAAGPETTNPYFTFTTFVANLRRRHSALRQRAWGNLADDAHDVSYLFTSPNGVAAPQPWDRCMRLHIDASMKNDCGFLLALNMDTSEVCFAIPPASPGKRWVRIIDTDAWAESVGNCWPRAHRTTIGDEYRVHPWSIVVLQEVDA